MELLRMRLYGQIFDAWRKAKDYMSAWFWIDTISTVPWDMAELIFPPTGSRGAGGTALKVQCAPQVTMHCGHAQHTQTHATHTAINMVVG